MTFAEFQTLVNANYSRGTGKAAAIKIWINQALVRVCAMHQWRDLHHTVPGYTTATYAMYNLPSNFSLELGLLMYDTAGNPYRLECLPYYEYDRDYRYRQPTAGTPTRWFPWGFVFYLHPTPDAQYDMDLRYIIKPATLVADADEPLLTNCDEAITNIATALALRSTQEFAEADRWWAYGMEALAAAKRRDQERPAVSYSRVPFTISAQADAEPYFKTDSLVPAY